MPIPLENEVVIVEPNTVKYDLSIASRISAGKLLVTVSVVLTPAKCDIIDNKEVWTDCPGVESKAWCAGDLEAYAVANPSLASNIMQTWGALSNVVAAINNQEKLL